MPNFNSIEAFSEYMNRDKTCLLLYTDGSCKAKTKQGGWGWILKRQFGNHLETLEKDCSGVADTTISRMEMTAILMGFLHIIERDYKNDELFVVSDSQFIVNSFNLGWFKRWELTDFIDRPNADLWKMFSQTLPLLPNGFKIFHTRGHEKGLEFHREGNREVDTLCSYKNFF